MLKTSFIISLFILFATPMSAQFGQLNYGVIVDGDTIPSINLSTVYIVTPRKFKTKRQEIRYTRMVRYVKKVYPYAKLAGQKLQKYDSLLREAPNEKAKKKMMKLAEKEIRAEYEGKLRKFTIGQGKILVKLIYRETNNTSYELLKELRGSVSAILWQGVGRIFGYNLKVKYEPYGTDYQIEQIVRLIDKGII
jgi:hypothetical protein